MTNVALGHGPEKQILTFSESEKIFNIDLEYIKSQIFDFSNEFLKQKINNKEIIANCSQYNLYAVDFIVSDTSQFKILEFNLKPDINLKNHSSFNMKSKIYSDVYQSLFGYLSMKYQYVLSRIRKQSLSLDEFYKKFEQLNCEFNSQY